MGLSGSEWVWWVWWIWRVWRVWCRQLCPLVVPGLVNLATWAQGPRGQGGHGDNRVMRAASTAVGVTRPDLPEATQRVQVREGGPSRPCQAPPPEAAQGLWASPRTAGLDFFPRLSDIFSSNLSTTRKSGSTSVSSGNPEHLLCSGHGSAHTTPSILACGTSTRALQRTGEAQRPRRQCSCQ